MRIRYAAKTDQGLKRNHNEDYFCLIEEEQLFLVADGMGGHACGEVASKMAHTLSVLENRLNVGIRLANKKTHESASKDVRLSGMGTTVVIGQIADDRFYVA